MAPTTEDAVEEVSESRSRAGCRRRRRRRPHEPAVTDHQSRATQSQPEAAPSSQRGNLEQSEGQRLKRRRKRNSKGHKKKKAAAALASTGVTHASDSDSEASSTVGSPLRCPLGPNPDDFGGPNAPGYHAATDAYYDLLGKYHEKRKRQQKLVTLDTSIPRSSLVKMDYLRSVRESATKTVLEVAKVVLGLSSYVDGNLMARTSGFLIAWDEESKTGTVLTSTRIICSKYSPLNQWSGVDEYSPNAEVVAHLLDEDDTAVPAQLVHYDKHINMTLFTFGIESCAKIPTFNSDVKYGQETFVIGRDENLNLTVDFDFVGFKGPTPYERPHHMFTGCAIREHWRAGPVIDFSGEVLVMANFPGSAFIPSSIILRCLAMWKKHQCIPRLHFAMKFLPVKFLDPIRVERIFRKCHVDSGLIVQEVSNGSNAEELGVRPGDIINSVNGKCIATTIELESLNIEMCDNHLDRGGTIGSWIDIPVGILHVPKGHEVRRVSLRLNVSDGMEVFARK